MSVAKERPADDWPAFPRTARLQFWSLNRIESESDLSSSGWQGATAAGMPPFEDESSVM